jgi:hypothetical protein
VAVVGAEGGLVDVARVHPHLVIARPEVQLREEAGAMELVQELVDHRNRELVL